MMLVLSAMIYPAIASSHTYITGTIKSGSSGLYDAKATAERVGEYKWTRTSSSGYYTLYTSTTNSYTVSASKTYYTRDTVNVSGGNTANLYLSSRSLTQVIFKIAYDPVGPKYITFQKAKDYLYSAEPWFKEEHGIDFADTGIGDSESWDTTNISSNSCYYDYLPDLKNEANWYSGNYGMADILIGFTDDVLAQQTHGCINNTPTSGGTHPYIAISTTSPDMARTVMHEITHAYGLDHLYGCNSQIPNIRASSCTADIYIKNWTPNDDQTLESRRGWY